jgi:hypothetical protein
VTERLRDGGEDRDRLRRLTERLDLAAERAERLLTESVRQAATTPPPPPDAAPESEPGRPPPSGWQRPREEPRPRERWLDGDELDVLMTILSGVRDRIPPDLRQRLAEAVRELLTALRALIDWYLERVERAAPGPTDVTDIPIL